MRKKLFVAFAVLAVMFGLVAGVASAQVSNKFSFEIPFSFTVDGNAMPSGTYEIQFVGSGVGVLTLRGANGGSPIVLKPATRLADTGRKEPRLAFDKVGDSRTLSEVHIPGIDGFELRGTAGEHGHESVSGKY